MYVGYFERTLHMKVLVVLFGYLTKDCVSAGLRTDVLVSCSLLEDDAAGGPFFTRTPSTLLLRDVLVAPDPSFETLTPFIPAAVPDLDAILFEAKASSPEIPDADLLLHADCNDQEVTCEISRYFPEGSKDGTGLAYFLTSLVIEGGGLGITMILRTLPVGSDKPEEPQLIQSRLKMALSPHGSLLTEVVFLVFSTGLAVSAPLKGDTLLSCGFRKQDMSPAEDVSLEWHLQHKGRGQRVVRMRVGLRHDTGQNLQVTERNGSHVDATLLVEEGNASLTLTRMTVADEGTYICTVSVGLFQAQQVIQLHPTQPPHVSLSEEKIVFHDELPQKLSCLCKKYYPLDVQMEWLFLSPTDTEAVLLPNQGSLSSHRQHGDGTFSLSSSITLVPSSFLPGTTITCKVSHTTLATPVFVSIMVEERKTGTQSYWMVLGFLIISVLFFYQVMG